MTPKEKIIQYVLHTPLNTNRSVLESLLDAFQKTTGGEFNPYLLVDKGEWEPNTAYNKYSVVWNDDGDVYIALLDSDVESAIGLGNTTYWFKIVDDVFVSYKLIDGGTASGYKIF